MTDKDDQREYRTIDDSLKDSSSHERISNVLVKTDFKSTSKVVSFLVPQPISRDDSSISGSEVIMKYNYSTSTSEEKAQSKTDLSRAAEKIERIRNNLEPIVEVENECMVKQLQGDEIDNRNERRNYLVESSSVDYPSECIPPWAKTLRKLHGMPVSRSVSKEREITESKKIMSEKIENIIKKHSELMLVKRVESKKQLILEPNKSRNEMDIVKMRAKNTKYYMTPLLKEDIQDFAGENHPIDKDYTEQRSLGSGVNENDSMSITRKTSRPKARKEISNIIKGLQNRNIQKSSEIKSQHSMPKDQGKCPKITLSKIRDFVNAQSTKDPDQQKLHEIIKIEKVASKNSEDKSKPTSKYIINIPRIKPTDIETVNVIKIKEKHKLRLQNIEDINEKVTELHYNQGSPQIHHKKENTFKQPLDNKYEEHISKTIKTPAEVKTFEVTSKVTPRIAPLIDQQKTDKVLLIQYDKKLKHGKVKGEGMHTTQILGIKRPHEDSGEMFLYGAETDGEGITENVTKVDDIPLTLKDKVHLIFEELREMTFKREQEPKLQTSEIEVEPSANVIAYQDSSVRGRTDEAMVQAMPETRSAEVQVRGSLQKFLRAPPPSLTSGQSSPKFTKFDDSLLQTLKEEGSEDLILDSGKQKGESHSSNEIPLGDLKQETKENELIDESKLEIPNIYEDVMKNEDILEKEEGKLEEEEVFETFERKEVETEEVSETIDKTEVESGEVFNKFKKNKVEPEELLQKNPTDTLEVKTKGVTFGQKTETVEEEEISTIFSELGSKASLTNHKEDEQLTGDADKLLSKMKKVSIQSSEGSVKSTDIRTDPEQYNVTSSESEVDEASLRKDSTKIISRHVSIEDIRSYDFDPSQYTELKIKLSSNKFHSQRESVRKRMNWTEDSIYLEKHTCPQLIRGLAETAVRRPADPISFLAHWIYKDYHNRERAEQLAVDKENLEVARAMMEMDAKKSVEPMKFNVRKYPVQDIHQNS